MTRRFVYRMGKSDYLSGCFPKETSATFQDGGLLVDHRVLITDSDRQPIADRKSKPC